MTGMLDSMEDEDIDEVLENSSGMMEYESCLKPVSDCNWFDDMGNEFNNHFSEGSGVTMMPVMLMKLFAMNKIQLFKQLIAMQHNCNMDNR